MSKHENYGKRAPVVFVVSMFLLLAITCIAAANSHAATQLHHHKSQHTHKHKRKPHHQKKSQECDIVVNGIKKVSHGTCPPVITETQTSTTTVTEVPSDVGSGFIQCNMAGAVYVPDVGCEGGGPIVNEPCYEVKGEEGKCAGIPPDVCEQAETSGGVIPLCKEFVEKESPCAIKICVPPKEECPEKQEEVAGPKG